MKVSLLRKYDDKVTAARQSAAKAQDWERVVAPDPALPLVSAGWENERTDIHGIGGTCYSWAWDDALNRPVHPFVRTVTINCYCGHKVTGRETLLPNGSSATDAAADEAFTLLVEHARAAALVPAA